MKRIRTALATLLFAVVLFGGTALAAFTDVPSFTMKAPKTATTGSEVSITITPKIPGFMDIQLLDSFGSVVMNLGEKVELHTKGNEFAFDAFDAQGNFLPVGDYTVSATMESQWGVPGKAPVTASLTIEPLPIEEGEEGEEGEGVTVTVSAIATNGNTAASGAAAAAPVVTETVSTAAGSGVMGEEGLLIGVGVSDAAQQTDAGYWGLTADATDAEIWAAITHPFVGVDVGENEVSYIYDSTKDGRKKLGSVSGISQGLNVVAEREDGWALVEAFRNEDGAFVRGYIRRNRLRKAEPNTNYGIVIDKAKQTLTVYKDGARVGSCSVSTGLATAKYLYRETPAGEFITVTRRGTIDCYTSGGKGYSDHTIRINGDYHLCEIPTTKRDGSDFSIIENMLGQKATRGNICIAQQASADGGINAEWIWDMTTNNKRVRVLIFDDKARDQVPSVQ